MTLLKCHLGSARFIYNWGLSIKKKQYDENKKSVSYNDLARQLTLIKQQEDYKWLNETNAVVLQQSLRHLDTAYNNFFRRIKNKQGIGYPKFKSKHNHNDSATYTSVKVNFDTMKLFVPKVGWIKLCKNRTFDADLKTTSMTISCDACGTFWVYILVHTNTDMKQPKLKEECKRTIGLDLGLKTFITDNQGNKVENPKYLELNAKRLTHLQRQLSRKVKGSNRRERARIKVARLHRRIRNQRLDFCHKLSTELVHNNDVICVENLDVKSMLERGIMSKSISSASWNTFISMLEYKCRWYGCHLVKIDTYFPSSQTCSVCGYVNKEVKNLNVRKWICPKCGNEHDRDINAATNILVEGIKNLARR